MARAQGARALMALAFETTYGTRSKHMDRAALDIAMTNHDPVAFEAAAREVGFIGLGFYLDPLRWVFIAVALIGIAVTI